MQGKLKKQGCVGAEQFPNMCYTVWELLFGNQPMMSMSKHEQAMPVVQGETLLYQQGGQDERLPVGTPAWHAWLNTARTFSFQSALGTFTARKEQASNKRGGGYWRAYRKRDGKLHRVYLGKSEELTLERLNAVAGTLAGQDTVAEGDERVPQGQLEETLDQERFLQTSTAASWSPAEHGDASASATRRFFTLP